MTTDARERSNDRSEDSERRGKKHPSDIVPRDVPDLVEKTDEKHRSDRIDMNAFTGEEPMDDEDES